MTNIKPQFSEHFENQYKNWFNVRDELKHLPVEKLRAMCDEDRMSFSVCALNIEGDLNVGMMARTALIMGANEFIIYGRRKIDNRSLVGANNYMKITKIDGLTEDGQIDCQKFKNTMKEMLLEPIFIETGGQVLDEFIWPVSRLPICLVFGNEGSGIPNELLTNAPFVVSIPQRGVLRSLNVAAAASIVMWDMRMRFYGA